MYLSGHSNTSSIDQPCGDQAPTLVISAWSRLLIERLGARLAALLSALLSASCSSLAAAIKGSSQYAQSLGACTTPATQSALRQFRC